MMSGKLGLAKRIGLCKWLVKGQDDMKATLIGALLELAAINWGCNNREYSSQLYKIKNGGRDNQVASLTKG
jgi:hypothetical protein